jgi:hypothetical protein
MSWGDVRFWIFLGICVFLFDGTPDVWDKLHDHAMQIGQCK